MINVVKNKEHRLWNRWKSMKDRCLNKNNKAYKNYGGRGITICERWLKFENYVEDLDDSYIEGYTIDRIDNDGHYEPNNVRWASYSEQNRNKTRCGSVGILLDTVQENIYPLTIEDHIAQVNRRIANDNKNQALANLFIISN